MKNGSDATVKTGEKMNFKIRKTIKRIAAITTGAALLGATMLGAGLAAEVSITPTEDAEVTTLLAAGGDATGITDWGTTLMVLGGDIADSNKDGMDNPLTDDDITTLQDDAISIGGTSYNFHDEFNLTSTGPKIGTSLTESDDDLGIKPWMFLDEVGSIQYYYVFDETINVSSATTSNDAELIFLETPLTITGVTDNTTFTAEVGHKYTLAAGESMTINGHVVELVNFDSDSALLDVDGKSVDFSATSTSKNPFSDLEIYFDSAISRTDLEESIATFIMGNDAVETIDDGDPFRGGDDDICDDDLADMDCWEWAVGELTGNAIGDTYEVGTTTSGGGGATIGVKSDHLVITSEDDPITVGGSYRVADSNYYFNFIETQPVIDEDSDDYAKITVEFTDKESLSDANSSLVREAGFRITISEEDGWTEQQSGNSKKSNKLFLHLNHTSVDLTGSTTGTVGATANHTSLYYIDDNNQWAFAGSPENVQTNITNDSASLARVTFGDTKTTNIDMRLLATEPLSDVLVLWFSIQDDEAYIGGGDDDIFLPLHFAMNTSDETYTAATHNIFDGIGNTSGQAEAVDLLWGATNKSIGTKDEDHLSRYGIIIKDPDTNIDGDDFIMYVPTDNVRAKVTVSYGSEGAAYDVKTYDEATSPVLYVGGPAVHPNVRTEHGWGSDPVYGADVAAKGGAWADFAAGCYYVDANEAWGWSAADSVTAVKAWLAGTKDGKVHC